MYSGKIPIRVNDSNSDIYHIHLSVEKAPNFNLKVWNKFIYINNADKLAKYRSKPNLGELFLIVDTEGTFRGRRIQDPANSELIRIHLIDTGKVIETQFETVSCYGLPKYLKFSELSTKCKIKNASNLLKDLLFKWVVLKKLISTDINPGYIEEYELLYVVQDDKSAINEPPKKLEPQGITKETLTEEQLSILSEETLNTSDPMIATLGYSVKDDTRCQFYDEKTGGCYKRGRCFKEHYPEDNHDVRSQTEIFFDNIPLQLDLPAVNSMIFIYPLHFEAIDLLYAHVVQTKNIKIDSESDLLKLDMMMNSPNALKSYEALQEIPALNQLVIAPGSNNKYYRAKICGVNDNDTCNVFFVDYGYKLTLNFNELKRYKVLYNFLPFQAVQLTIGNIKAVTNPFFDMVAIEELNVWIKKNSFNFHAKILQNVGDIVINLFDNEGFDVGELLVASKKARAREFLPIGDENNMIPG
ncbi:unnamed protein product [Diamesa serratosioi]